MSLFQFLASGKLLQEVKNPYIEFISINDALNRDIELADFVVNDADIDKDEKNIMICDTEEHLQEMEVVNNMYYSSQYAEEYSEKKYFAELRWRFTEVRAKQLVDYLKEQLKTIDEIEIWSIWLDEHKPAEVKSTSIEELSIYDLKFLDATYGYEKPKCLIVRRRKNGIRYRGICEK